MTVPRAPDSERRTWTGRLSQPLDGVHSGEACLEKDHIGREHARVP